MALFSAPKFIDDYVEIYSIGPWCVDGARLKLLMIRIMFSVANCKRLSQNGGGLIIHWTVRLKFSFETLKFSLQFENKFKCLEIVRVNFIEV